MVVSSLLTGVFPVLATPFDPDGRPAEADLAAIVEYAVGCGVDGITYPGVASEFDHLSDAERIALVALVAKTLKGRAQLIVGASAPTPEQVLTFARQARDIGAKAVMVMAPAKLTDPKELEAFYRAIAAEAGLPIMLQNAPPPVGAGHSVETLLAIVRAVPEIAYLKEETLPCGQRITRLLEGAPPSLRGIFGGAGGRYIVDELQRGALGTMPAVELTEIHVALVAAFRRGAVGHARTLFNRMLPVLNFQAVFRMSLTKEVLKRRHIITHSYSRAPVPKLDAGDHAEITAMLDEIRDLLPTRSEFALKESPTHG
jgi:4-hydroxy-tetrahydrodipicolinate synthase